MHQQLQEQRTGNEILNSGAEIALGLTLPSGLEALRNSLGKLSTNPGEISEVISHFPERAREVITELFAAMITTQEGLERALDQIDSALRSKGSASVKFLTDDRGLAYEPASTRVPLPLSPEDLCVVVKRSKLQRDLMSSGLGYGTLMNYYEAKGEDRRRIESSHWRQQTARMQLERVIPVENFVHYEAVDSPKVKQAKALVSLGGDNHFQFVTHLSSGDTPVLGLNSDRFTSNGALLRGRALDTDSIIDSLRSAQYSFTPWTRLRVEVDGETPVLATCDVFLGERERKLMSHHTLLTDDAEIPQHSSGLIVSTGAGSTGWLRSAAGGSGQAQHVFDPSASYARFILSEAGEEQHPSSGVLLQGRRLGLRSMNGKNGIVSVDSLEDIAFPRGKTVSISTDSKPLWIIEGAGSNTPTEQELLRERADAVADSLHELGAFALQLRENGLQIDYKGVGDPVTNADRAISEILTSRLQAIYDVPVVSEENLSVAEGLSEECDYWLIDPIDGTRSYLEGYDSFGINVALIREGRPVAGIVALPAHNKVYQATLGGGAFLRSYTDGTMKALKASGPIDGVVKFGNYHTLPPEVARCQEELLAINGVSAENIVPCSSVMKYCLVLEGELSAAGGMLPLASWDLAAVDILLKEAGGSLINLETGEAPVYSLQDFIIPNSLALASEFKAIRPIQSH